VSSVYDLDGRYRIAILPPPPGKKNKIPYPPPHTHPWQRGRRIWKRFPSHWARARARFVYAVDKTTVDVCRLPFVLVTPRRYPPAIRVSVNCGPEEFQCHDGRCLSIDKRCDGKKECSTGEDEANCQIPAAATDGFGTSKQTLVNTTCRASSNHRTFTNIGPRCKHVRTRRGYEMLLTVVVAF